MLMVTMVFTERDPLVQEMLKLLKTGYNRDRFGSSITIRTPRCTMNVADFLQHKTMRVVCRAHDSLSIQRNILKSLRDGLGMVTYDDHIEQHRYLTLPGYHALEGEIQRETFRGGSYEVPDATNQ